MVLLMYEAIKGSASLTRHKQHQPDAPAVSDLHTILVVDIANDTV